MGKIVAYHPEIHVRKREGEFRAIKADMDDWYEDKEVLQQMAASVGARTVGELVESLEGGGSEEIRASTTNNVISCRVETPSRDEVCGAKDGYWDWDEQI